MAYTTIRTQTLVVSNTETVTRGFLAKMVEYAGSKPKFSVADLVKRFSGKNDNGKKVSSERVVRYAYYCVRNGIFAVAPTK